MSFSSFGTASSVDVRTTVDGESLGAVVRQRK